MAPVPKEELQLPVIKLISAVKNNVEISSHFRDRNPLSSVVQLNYPHYNNIIIAIHAFDTPP